MASFGAPMGFGRVVPIPGRRPASIPRPNPFIAQAGRISVASPVTRPRLQPPGPRPIAGRPFVMPPPVPIELPRITEPFVGLRPPGRIPQLEGRRTPMQVMPKPGDERGFIHKKIFKTISRIAPIIPGIGGTISKVTSFLGGGGAPQVLNRFPQQPFQLPHSTPTKFSGSKPCAPGTVRSSASGICVAPASPVGTSPTLGIAMEAVNGRYGPAQVPISVARERRECEAGMVLGKDGLCYATLPNRFRLYPRGRRPLLTGGDMRAISRAASAGRKLANTRSDLTAIGMLKAPARKRRRAKRC